MSNIQYAFTDPGGERISANLLYVSLAKYEEDWHSTPHTHPFSEFFYVFKGSGSFFVETSTFDVRPNDLVVVNPNVQHTEISNYSDPLEYIVFGLGDVSFRFHSSPDSERYSLFSFQEMQTQMQFYLRRLSEEAEAKRPHYREICQNLLEIVLVQMARQMDFTLQTGVSRRANLVCSIAKRYIDTHFKEPITLEKLAEITHVNKYYLAHIFSNDFGVSPINYLIVKRIEESRLLLESTDHSVSQIASFLGFSSQSYFAQAFKKSEGLSPLEYRRQIRRQAAMTGV